MNVRQSEVPLGAQLNIFSQMFCVLAQFFNPMYTTTLVLTATPGMPYGQHLDPPDSVSIALSTLLFYSNLFQGPSLLQPTFKDSVNPLLMHQPVQAHNCHDHQSLGSLLGMWENFHTEPFGCQAEKSHNK